jgi:multidrug efflux pump subunit AcrA (membrane-fusion protein)
MGVIVVSELVVQSKDGYYSYQLTQVPKYLRLTASGLVSCIVLWGLALLFVPWQQTSLGFGKVLAYSPTERQQSIDAPVEGRLVRWFVQEGSVVQAGDPIVEITDNDPEILNRLKAEKNAVQSRLDAAKISLKVAKINLDRQKTLFDQGLSSRRSYELATLEYAKYITDEANAKTELVRVETRLARQTTQFVTAPRGGAILRRIAGENSVLVKSGESLAVLVPDTSSRAVELLIDGSDISLVHLGQEVRLQFEGWPAIQFSGWPAIAVGTFTGRVSIIDAADNGGGKFRVLVSPISPELWPPSNVLRQGVRAQGWVLLGRVKLGYEIWRRFNGFPALRTAPPGETGKQKKG